MPMLPATISEPPPAYSSTPPHHHSGAGYHNLHKDDRICDPITGERLRPYGYSDRSARANRQRMWCCFTLAMVMVVIALVIAGAVYHFGRTNDSDDDNCHESVLNGYTCD
jgi:hypothetical protein